MFRLMLRPHSVSACQLSSRGGLRHNIRRSIQARQTSLCGSLANSSILLGLLAAATELCCTMIFLEPLTESANGALHAHGATSFHVHDHPADRAELCVKARILAVHCYKRLQQGSHCHGKITGSGAPCTTVTITKQTVCCVKELLVTG